jgi:hypothetical protein
LNAGAAAMASERANADMDEVSTAAGPINMAASQPSGSDALRHEGRGQSDIPPGFDRHMGHICPSP